MSESVHRLRILLLVTLPLVGVLAVIFLLWQQYVFPSDIILLLSLYVLTAMGITVGYHRMLTHQGFESSRILRAFFLILGCMAFEGKPTDWAATHIKHHAHSDDEGDPHSPLEGFWHAHFGWLFSKENFGLVHEYAPHLLQDRTVRFVDRTFVLWMALSLALPWILGGWTGFLWGGLARVFLVNHITWSVNSVCHCFGKRPFETTDESRNEWVVGLLALGEGWHNNHHAFPRNAFHGMRWWQFDLSGIVLRSLESVGFIWNVQRVSEEVVLAHASRTEKSQETLKKLREDLWATIATAKQELETLLAKPFQTALGDSQFSEVLTFMQAASKRLEEIQNRLSLAHHLRKQKLLAYRKEVGEILTHAKERAQLLQSNFMRAHS